MESAVANRLMDLGHDRRRCLRRLAACLGDLCEDIEALSLNAHRWQGQIDGVDAYIRNRERWIAQAEREIAQTKARIEQLEAEYYTLNEEG